MVYPVYIIGHTVLRKKAVDIEKDYPGLDDLVSDLFETMYRSDGIGLAAPQIGKSIRLFVVDGTPIADGEPELEDFRHIFINAEITERSGEVTPMTEGCLSIPKLHEEVNRESFIRISYYDENWVWHNATFDGYKARIIQHEYDHLDGILFTDRVSPIRKRLLKSKLTALGKGKFDVNYKTILASGKSR